MKILNEIRQELYEMANYPPLRTGLDFSIWVDSAGENRNKPDSELRIKCKTVDKKNDITVSLEKSPRRFPLKNAPKLTTPDERRLKELKEFVKKHRDVLLAHQKGDIDDTALGLYFTLVTNGKSIDDAFKEVKE